MQPSIKPQPNWSATLGQAYGNLSQALQLIWTASPRGALVMLVLAVLGGGVMPGVAWTKKLMIDQVVGFVSQGVDPWTGLRTMLPLLFLILILLLCNNIIAQGRSLAEKSLQAKLSLHINSLIIEKALTLDLSHFEQSEFYDKLQNARHEADQRALDIVVQGHNLIQTSVTFFIFALLLMRFSPWLVIILLGATLPSFGLQNKYGQFTFRLLSGQAPGRRQMKYFEELLTVDRYVKEIKLFGLGRMLLGRYTQLFWQLFDEDMTLAWRRSLVSLVWGTIALTGYFGSIAWIMFRTIAGAITFGDAVLYLEVFERSHYMGQNILISMIRLYENSLFVSNVFAFLDLEPELTPTATAEPVPVRFQKSLEFKDMSFKYPGKTSWALRGINLTLHPGEKLALVGLNGAGKTTLVKLVARLYDPTEGQILLDGVPLNQYDQAEWHKKLGVIFQDFVQYQFTAAENIGVGQIESIADQARITMAAHKGGAHQFLVNLPAGYNTMLGKWFENGHELSQGQWQKVALSRAFMRRAEILILDEPTASLDAEQEYRIFQQFQELTKGKTAVLISHRFSTVRMADRIAVIEDGRISELGSHDDLMVLNGSYARLFNLQAQGYR
jgi:ATP-binding cassette subfamily B protein